MRYILATTFLLAAANAFAAVSGYELALNAQPRNGGISVAPTIAAPPGTKLRYEIVASKRGRSSGDSRQAGNVTVGSSGTASLSKLSFSVGAGEKCEIAVKVYEADKLVAAQSSDCAR
jgi:hypothetical protein